MIAYVAISAFFMTLFGMPPLIKVAKLKHFVDEPSEDRKIHHRSIPTIGGVMIFISVFFNVLFWAGFTGAEETFDFSTHPLMGACLVLIFFMGLKDDLIGMSPSKKLLIHLFFRQFLHGQYQQYVVPVHLFVGFALTSIGGYRIESFGGLFGVNELPENLSIAFSIFVYIVIVNAWNLIDGLDGLAAGFTVIAMSAFAYWFLSVGASSEALLAISTAGTMLGFLVFNFAPARIFMGDCGSLFIGVIGYVLATSVISTPTEAIPDHLLLVSKEVLVMGVLSYPLVDTLRVFMLRAARGISPFHPDRNHLHHRLMMQFGTHSKTAISVYAYSIVMILLSFTTPYFRGTLPMEILFIGLLTLAFGLFYPTLRMTRKRHIQNVSEVGQKVNVGQ